jgi:dTDP-4-dehydrorhamnose 3,5-epimerase
MTNVVEAHAIGGVVVKELKAHPDPRGRFLETYREEWFPGRPAMVQGNRSDNIGNVLRGLHYHLKQADYWYVTAGKIFVALADLRKDSPTRGQVATLWLGEEDRAVYIPPGVAHGYYAPGPATMTYLVDNYYDGDDEFGVAWDCPQLAIPWPLEGQEPLLSDRDQSNPPVSGLDPYKLP